jgi:hypothetical protein
LIRKYLPSTCDLSLDCISIFSAVSLDVSISLTD